jgi:hypothetical protein
MSIRSCSAAPPQGGITTPPALSVVEADDGCAILAQAAPAPRWLPVPAPVATAAEPSLIAIHAPGAEVEADAAPSAIEAATPAGPPTDGPLAVDPPAANSPLAVDPPAANGPLAVDPPAVATAANASTAGTAIRGGGGTSGNASADGARTGGSPSPCPNSNGVGGGCASATGGGAGCAGAGGGNTTGTDRAIDATATAAGPRAWGGRLSRIRLRRLTPSGVMRTASPVAVVKCNVVPSGWTRVALPFSMRCTVMPFGSRTMPGTQRP